jgi:hypothetical protein
LKIDPTTLFAFDRGGERFGAPAKQKDRPSKCLSRSKRADARPRIESKAKTRDKMIRARVISPALLARVCNLNRIPIAFLPAIEL